jgi:hypothetical protein
VRACKVAEIYDIIETIVLKRARILILDKATSALDTSNTFPSK